MPIKELDSVPIAVRVYPDPQGRERSRSKRSKSWRRPKAMLVFDTETTTDSTQRLLFGCYRFFVRGECLEEGLFYADDLPRKEVALLKKYAAKNLSDTIGRRELKLFRKRDFMKRFFKATDRGRCLLVGFNLPFDLSRLGFDAVPARAAFAGGFSIGLASYFDKNGVERRNGYKPRICIKHIDSKRSLLGFTGRNKPDTVDLIPEDSHTGKPEPSHKFRGHFLDLRTLAFALTDRGHSLESACKAFGVEHGKTKAKEHGKISEEYIDYNRRDVLATSELALKLLEEFDKHPINLQETKAFSPASVGKKYLRAMGVNPVLERHSNFQRYLGYAQTAFFGGRTSAHIRKIPVPVVYTDFLSMYPTVNSLMRLQDLVVARNIKVIDHCNDEISAFLSSITSDLLFEKETWSNKYMRGFARVIPDGNVLPQRAKFSPDANDWQVGINYLYADKSENALWFSVPDLVASVLLTGKVPQIVDAFRLEPCSQLKTLRPTKLGGVIEIDPRTQDFFKMVIEERKRTAKRTDLTDADKTRLSGALKVFANSTSYGIYAEMNRQETEARVPVRCYGLDTPYTCKVANPEKPGEYCFPPLASLITGAARLMLALLEHSVTSLGGTYAMEDTDSMAIVTTKRGGLVSCPGGRHRLKSGAEAEKSLSWKQVEEISKKFESLRPYDEHAIPGSILKIEEDNYDPKTTKQRQLWCYAISAKRYVLFIRANNGNPELLRKDINSKDNHWSEHGLGHLLNPIDPESEDREWIAQVWLNLVRDSFGLSKKKLKFENIPAIGRITVSSPAVMRPLEFLNKGKKYSDQIKPFNFLLSCHVQPLGHPVGTDPSRFHLIAPYETDSRKWLKKEWIDQYSGNSYLINSTGNYSSRRTARVKTYGDVISDYEFHPEAKCADSSSNVCTKQTVGLLRRRHIGIDQIKLIGKESNSLEEVDAGTIHSADSVYTEYSDCRRDFWETKVRVSMNKTTLRALVEAIKATGNKPPSRRTLIYARTGQKRPHPSHQAIIIAGLRSLTLL